MKRTPEREQFLSDMLIGAIEHSGYGFPGIVEYEPEPNGDPGQSYAIIYDRYDRCTDDSSYQSWRIDIDTMAKGLGIVRKMPGSGAVADWVSDLIAADRT